MREFRIAVLTVFAALIFIYPSLAAQDAKSPGAATQDAPPVLKAWNNEWVKQLFTRVHPVQETINVDAAQGIPTLQSPRVVSNGSTVTLKITKRPVDDCKLKTESEKYPTESTLSSVGQLLAFLGTAAGGKSIAEALDGQIQTEAESIAGAPESVKRKFAVLDRELEDAKSYAEAYQNVKTEVNEFIDCASKSVCKDNGSYPTDAEAQGLHKVLNQLLYNITPPDTMNLDLMANDLTNELATDSSAVSWFLPAQDHLDEDRKRIYAIKILSELRDKLKMFNEELETYMASPKWIKTLPPQKGTKFTGTVTCVNHFTHEQFGSDVPFTVLYYNPAPVTASAGVLISPLSKRPIGVLSQSTPCDGTTIIMNCYAVTTTSDAQFVPIGLGNLYLSGSTKLNLNVSGGIGVNLNNGSTQMEYFLGPSVGIHGFYISPGLDFISFPSLKDGLQLGDPAPTGSNASNPPLVYHHTIHFAFTMSYRLTRGK